MAAKRKLTQEERKKILQDPIFKSANPAGSVLDQYGNLTRQNTKFPIVKKPTGELVEQTPQVIQQAREDIERAKASQGKSLSAARQQEVVQQQQAVQEELTQQPNITEQDILAAVPQEPIPEAIKTLGAGVGAGTAVLAGGGGALGLGGVAAAVGSTGVGLLALGVAAVAAYGVISYEKRQDVKQAKKVAQTATSNFTQITNALNAGTISKEEAIRRFKESKVALYAAQANLKRETDKDLDRFLSGGADEMTVVNDQVDDLESIYTQAFLQALAAPNPANITVVPPTVTEQDNV